MSLISRFSQKLKVYRDINPEKTIKGKKAPDKVELLEIMASVQPFQPKEIVEAEIGSERASDAIKIYSDVKLKILDEEKRMNADLVEYDGDMYEVRKVDKWQKNMMNLSHYKAVAYKVNKVLPR